MEVTSEIDGPGIKKPFHLKNNFLLFIHQEQLKYRQQLT